MFRAPRIDLVSLCWLHVPNRILVLFSLFLLHSLVLAPHNCLMSHVYKLPVLKNVEVCIQQQTVDLHHHLKTKFKLDGHNSFSHHYIKIHPSGNVLPLRWDAEIMLAFKMAFKIYLFHNKSSKISFSTRLADYFFHSQE